jgi:hypothetical protein
MMNPNEIFVQVGYWKLEEGGFQECTSDMACSQVMYRSGGNKIIPESWPDIEDLMTDGMKVVLFAIGGIFLLVTAFTGAGVYYHRKEKEIRSSQPEMLIFILIGAVMGAGRVINAALDITNTTCIAGLWLGHLAFFFAFGALFVKIWRVHRLVNNRTLKKITIKSGFVVKVMLTIIGLAVCYMIFLTVFGQPHRSEIKRTTSNQSTIYDVCRVFHPEVHTTLFAIEAAILLYGAILCYSTRDVPDSLNESGIVASGE